MMLSRNCSRGGVDFAGGRSPNGQTTTTSYDSAGRTLSTIAKNSTGTTLTSRVDVYRTVPSTGADQSLLASMTDQSGTTTYGYDGLNRLTQATEGATVNNWAYDNDGKRTKPPRPRVEPPDLTERERAR